MISLDRSGLSLEDSELQPGSNDWATWRGPTADGLVPIRDSLTDSNSEDDGNTDSLERSANSRTVRTEWSESDTKWAADVPGLGHGSPIVVGELVVVPTAIETTQKQLLLAFDRQTGAEIWQTEIHSGKFPESGKTHPKATNANSTVASDGTNFFISFLHNERIVATSVDGDGEIRWQTDIGAFNSIFGYAASPVIYRSVAIFTADNVGGGYIVALDRNSGKIAWRIARDALNSYSSPIIATLDTRDQLIISGGGYVRSYDPNTGEENWNQACLADTTCGTAVVTGNKIFASGGYPKNETVGLSSTGEILWTNKARIYEPSLIAVDGAIYTISDAGIAYCWNASDGTEHWRKRVGGNFSSSPISVDGKIYIGDLDGSVHIFAASTDDYKEIAVNRMGTAIYASPAVSRGELFYRVRTDSSDSEKLICISANLTDGKPADPS